MNEFYIDPVLYTGRPADCTDRLAKEVRTYDLLDKLAIPYSRMDHTATATMEDCHDIDTRLDIAICKNRFSLQRTENRFLPSNDARREKIQNRSSVQTDWERPPVLCRS